MKSSERKLKKPPDLITNIGSNNHFWLQATNNEISQDLSETNKQQNIEQQGLLPYIPVLIPHRTWQNRLQNTVLFSDIVWFFRL